MLQMKIADKYLQLRKDLRAKKIVILTGITEPTVKNCLAGREVGKHTVAKIERCIDEILLKFDSTT